jgi:flagellar biosynthesis protein FlhB
MDNKEKQILVTIITLILIFAGYAFYVYQKHIEPDVSIINNFQFWGKTFLIFIPVTIVSQIVIHIVFAIINKIVTNEDMPTINDERDKLIELKSIRISHWIFTIGFLLSMVTLVLEMPPYAMFITLIASGFISGIVAEIAKFYYYRKGV